MESIENINRRLLDYFGKFNTTDLPNYRVVWSEDQYEKRWTNYSKEGFELSNPEVQLLPKYKQYISEKYILERCLAVPLFIETDLVEKYSYEPLWVFEDKDGFPLPPKWEAIEIIIDQVHKQAAKTTGAKYHDIMDGLNSEEQKEAYEAQLNRVKEEFFGNETDLTDALGHKEGIVVP